MLDNNRQINWLPEHIREGRMGNFLETNVDWALSRERYWGTPLPIWVCEETGYTEAVGSYAELLAKPGVAGTEAWQDAKRQHPELSDDLSVHKPYIDAVTYDSPKAPGERMRRVREVIDCWFDTGAMPFAQWGYPHRPGSAERFADQFPADFISEALDQTRGWFYSLLAISTLLFSEGAGGEAGERPAEPGASHQCGETGHPSGTRRHSLSASLPQLHRAGADAGRGRRKDVEEQAELPRAEEIFNLYGADALRWYFSPTSRRGPRSATASRRSRRRIPEFLLRLWNVYSFFVIYANIDGFDPARRDGRHRRASSTPGGWPGRRATARRPSGASWTAGSSAS